MSCLQLLQEEIVDETDMFVDNLQTSRVNASKLAGGLPPRLRVMLDRGAFTPRIGRLGMVGKAMPTEIWCCSDGPFETSPVSFEGPGRESREERV